MSRKLFLIRHAKAVGEYHTDFFRPLTNRGYHEAVAAADYYANLFERPELIITSPAMRAFTTAAIFAKSLNYDLSQIQLAPQLYESSADEYLRTITAIESSINIVLLFGHNNSLSDAVIKLTGDTSISLKTAGYAALEIETDWNNVKSNSAKLLALYEKVHSQTNKL